MICRCAACGEQGTVSPILHFSRIGPADGNLAHGYVPLCATCAPTCATCGRIALVGAVEQMIADTDHTRVALAWAAPVCTDPTHRSDTGAPSGSVTA